MFDWLKNPILKRLLATGIRRGLDALGALLIAKSYATDAEWDAFVASAAPLLLSLLWSLWEKAQADKKIAVALNLPAGSDPAVLDTVMKHNV